MMISVKVFTLYSIRVCLNPLSTDGCVLKTISRSAVRGKCLQTVFATPALCLGVYTTHNTHGIMQCIFTHLHRRLTRFHDILDVTCLMVLSTLICILSFGVSRSQHGIVEFVYTYCVGKSIRPPVDLVFQYSQGFINYPR